MAEPPGAVKQLNMQTKTQDDLVLRKTKELCQAILEQPDTRAALERIELFMADDRARNQYESLMSLGQELNKKQQSAVPLTPEEIAAFEKDREALLENPVARGFLDAREEMSAMHNSITKYVTKALELGRVPAEEDFESCGHGCSCGHSH
jgi:cell fate (sporulation/competence/biofilm development) regulator YlbF (YheA/YmcA/DUF963 family)